jgi:hypothetical protein
MALTRRTAIGVLVGLAALVSTAANPNFELKDLPEPYRVVRKFDYHSEYQHSGKVLVGSYAAFAGSLFALGYNALTGNFIRRQN